MDNHIRDLRKKRGITQQECAEAIGISVRTLQRYEKGETENLTIFLKIADYLKVDINKLLGK